MRNAASSGQSALGRPRTIPLRGVVDALLYILRTAYPRRLLPREFPKRSTVQRYSYAWQAQRLWEKVPTCWGAGGREGQPVGRGD